MKRIWGEVKAEEKKEQGRSRPDAARRRAARLPALVEAQQIARARRGVGFDWENPEQVLEKLDEELAEFDAGAPQRRRRTSWKTNWATCCSCW